MWFASVTYALLAAAINIGVALADVARTILVKVLALSAITNFSDTVLSCAIWVGEVVAVLAFSILAELLSSSAGVLNACTSIIDEMVISANCALVVLDVHLILGRVTFFTSAQHIEDLLCSAACLITYAFIRICIGVGIISTIRAMPKSVSDLSGGAFSCLDTLPSLWVWTVGVWARGAAPCCLQIVLTRTGLLLAASIVGINIVIFVTAEALVVVNIEAIIAGFASSELVQNLESRAVGRVVLACLSCGCLWVGVILAVLTSSTLLEDLPISALLQVAGAASLCGISVGVVQAIFAFTSNIEVLSIKTQSLVADASSAGFIRVGIGKAVLAFTNDVEYCS